MGIFKKTKHDQVRRPRISDGDAAYAFRRSRTLTGSLSSSVRAAVEDRADLQSDRMKHHSLRRTRRHLSTYWLLTLGAVVGLWVLLGQFVPSTELVAVAKAPTALQASYREAVEAYFRGHPHERFLFALDSAALTRSLQAQFPEVAQVRVTRGAWMRPGQATIALRQPVATWTIAQVKYYIDDHGVAFQRFYGAEPPLVVEDKSGIDPAGAGAVASTRMLHYVGRLVALLKQSGFGVEKVELPPATSRQIDVRLTGKGYAIKTSLDRDPAGQVADIVSTVRFLEQRKISPSYADVRVSSKLYYK